MTTVDTLISGGLVHTPYGPSELSIAINDGKIVALGKDSALPNSESVIDATGKVVFPGLIDTHVHFREPGYTYKEDFTTGTQAAAAGGFTMVVDMPNVNPPTNTVQAFKEKNALARSKAVIDFGHHAGATLLEELPGLARAGATAFKIYMVNDPKTGYPHDSRLFIGNDGVMLDTFKAIKSLDMTAFVHTTDQEIFENQMRKHASEGKTDPMTYTEDYLSEDLVGDWISTAKIVLLAELTGVRLHVCHTRSERAIRMIEDARKAGYQVTNEVNPKYFLFTKEHLKMLGPHLSPNALEEKDRIALLGEVKSGHLTVFATDHAPHTWEEQEPGWKDTWNSPNGSPQIEDTLPALLTLVNRGVLALDAIPTYFSSNPAKLIGVYPQKGAISVGSDADLALVDLKVRRKVSKDRIYSKVGWSPFEGREMQGAPVLSMVRGNVVSRDGVVEGKPGSGRWVPGPKYAG